MCSRVWTDFLVWNVTRNTHENYGGLDLDGLNQLLQCDTDFNILVVNKAESLGFQSPCSANTYRIGWARRYIWTFSLIQLAAYNAIIIRYCSSNFPANFSLLCDIMAFPEERHIIPKIQRIINNVPPAWCRPTLFTYFPTGDTCNKFPE